MCTPVGSSALKRIMPTVESRIRYVDYIQERGTDFFRLACEQNLEGIVGKWCNRTYQPNGATSWVKIKNATYSQAEGRHELFEKRRMKADRPRGTKPELAAAASDTVTLTYTIDPDQRLITPRRKPGFGFLRDLRAATTPVDAATAVSIMQVVRAFWPLLQPSRAAVLTPREVDTAALTAQALADAEHMPLQVFNSYHEAMDWLHAKDD